MVWQKDIAGWVRGLAAAGFVAAACSQGMAQTLPSPPADGPVETLPTPQRMPAAPAVQPPLTLDGLIQLGLERNPRLAQAEFAIDTARGRALQAGLYPNPTVSATLDELGDREGPGGINTIPLVSQEIVTGGKLRLSRAAANREVDQATLGLMTQRYTLLNNVRQAYFDVLTLQRRLQVLAELVKLADQSVEQTRKLLEAKRGTRLDLVQLEVEAERLRAEREATERELPAAFRRLAAVVGVGNLPVAPIVGTLDLPLPDYDLERTQRYVLSVHPEIRSAEIGVERAQLLSERARKEPIPNVTVGAGYVRQNQNRSDDWTIGVSVPVPLWNRNQGNILAAQAQVGEAVQEVGRVENELTDRVAGAFRDYAAARQRAERYRTAILPRAKEAYELSVKAYQGGLFEYLRVLEAQRAVAQANLEYIRALGEAWKAAAAISGLTLEERWPAPLAPTRR
jgi:cobalt-zinc-cadmium efflux system outer membrane protein